MLDGSRNRVKFSPDSACNLLADATVVMACPAIGHVGQLAVDLLLETVADSPHRAELNFAANVTHPDLLPVAGLTVGCPADAKGAPKLMTACQAFEVKLKSRTESGRILLIQIRSEVEKGRRRGADFVTDFAQLCSDCGVKRVIIVGSSDAAERLDAQLTGPQVRLVSNRSRSGVAPLEPRKRLYRVNVKDVAACQPYSDDDDDDDEQEKEEEEEGSGAGDAGLANVEQGEGGKDDEALFLPGCGFARRLYKLLKGTTAVETDIVLAFAFSVGFQDALARQLALGVNAVLNEELLGPADGVAFRTPASWNMCRA